MNFPKFRLLAAFVGGPIVALMLLTGPAALKAQTPDLTKNYEMVEAVINDLGVDAAETRGDKPGVWSLTKGDSKVWLDLWYIATEKRAYFQTLAPVIRVPANAGEELYKYLLAENDKLFGVSFTVYDDWIWMKTIREVEGIDEHEINFMITRVGNYAEKYTKDLREKYPKPKPQD